ncbi:MAG: hypothetical protein U0457_15760 [Candidatus Sericytochromatia bacterium]
MQVGVKPVQITKDENNEPKKVAPPQAASSQPSDGKKTDKKDNKNPIEKTVFKPINDAVSISLAATGAVQAPAQIALFPKVLSDTHNSVKALPVINKIVPNLAKTSEYLEKTKLVSAAIAIGNNPTVSKVNAGLTKAAPYLNTASCSYTIAKNIMVLKNKNETDSHKLKAKVQIGLNAVSAVTGFSKGNVGLAISAATGISSVGIDFLWK